MVDVDTLGRAIHAAKRVGGPWGPACMVFDRELIEYVEIEYDADPNYEFDCECKAMAQHLIDNMEGA